MKLVTLAQADAHVVAEGEDAELLTLYCNAAEAACARIANRNLYKSSADLTAALATIPTVLADAYATYDAAMTSAEAAEDERVRLAMEDLADVRLEDALTNVDAIKHGLALDATNELGQPIGDDIIAGILFMVGHMYRNREAVATGSGAAAVEVPQTTEAIMLRHRWIGPL